MPCNLKNFIHIKLAAKFNIYYVLANQKPENKNGDRYSGTK